MMSKRRYLFFLFAGLALADMVLIFIFSSQTASVSSGTSASVVEIAAKFFNKGFETLSQQEQLVVVTSWQTAVRKAAHFMIYASLGFFLMGTAYFAEKSVLKRRVFAAALVGLLYAASDEIHQIFVPGRGPMVTDVLLDFCGVVVGGLIFMGMLRGWSIHIIRLHNKMKKKVN